jgi:hypothetical protein
MLARRQPSCRQGQRAVPGSMWGRPCTAAAGPQAWAAALSAAPACWLLTAACPPLAPPPFPALRPQDSQGRKVPWGNMPYEWLFGQKGWCEAERPDHL